MARAVRRVVTGHDARGKAVVCTDGAVPVTFTNPLRPGYMWSQVWMTDSSPAVIDNGPDPTNRPIKIEPGERGSVIRIIEFPEETAEALALAKKQSKEVFAGMGSVAAATGRPMSRHPLMHRTNTVDYGIVLEGEITMVLDDSDVELAAGDVVVQRGTNHAWSNRSGKPCRMAFILLDATPTPEVQSAIAAFDAAAAQGLKP
jgi:mannose-6-phosphate isomerase-like protein (cupin superfamily)